MTAAFSHLIFSVSVHSNTQAKYYPGVRYILLISNATTGEGENLIQIFRFSYFDCYISCVLRASAHLNGALAPIPGVRQLSLLRLI